METKKGKRAPCVTCCPMVVVVSMVFATGETVSPRTRAYGRRTLYSSSISSAAAAGKSNVREPRKASLCRRSVYSPDKRAVEIELGKARYPENGDTDWAHRCEGPVPCIHGMYVCVYTRAIDASRLNNHRQWARVEPMAMMIVRPSRYRQGSGPRVSIIPSFRGLRAMQIA